MADTDITPADFIALADALEDQAREQGRREVYRAILKRFPDQIEPQYGMGSKGWGTYCCWCEAFWQPMDRVAEHPDNDCLWLRARAAVESAKANHEQP